MPNLRPFVSLISPQQGTDSTAECGGAALISNNKNSGFFSGGKPWVSSVVLSVLAWGVLVSLISNSAWAASPLKAGVKAAVQHEEMNTYDSASWNKPTDAQGVLHLKVFVNTRPQKRSLFKPEYLTYVKDVLSQWSSASLGKIQFQWSDSPKNADIRIHWVDKLTNQKGVRYANEVNRLNSKRDIEKSDVRILVGQASVMQTHLLREVGSALGLEYDESLNSVMCGVQQAECLQFIQSVYDPHFSPYLSYEDIGKLRNLYQISPYEESVLGAGHVGATQLTQADLKTFLSTVDTQIRSQWTTPPLEHKTVTVRVKIDHQGQLVGCEVKKSSQATLFDEAAVAAVKKASPFIPLPPAFTGEFLSLDYKFKS
jgi:TonB family protein